MPGNNQKLVCFHADLNVQNIGILENAVEYDVLFASLTDKVKNIDKYLNTSLILY